MKVLTIGTFDMLHEGHLNFLYACARFGTVHVGVNSDQFVLAYKGKKPVMSYRTRSAVVFALAPVSEVHENEEKGQRLIRKVAPDLLVIGSDWAAKDYYKQIGLSRSELERMGIQLVYIPYTDGISSTLLRENLTDVVESCHASRDGDCSWSACPQLRDNEPHSTGRHCPIDNRSDEE